MVGTKIGTQGPIAERDRVGTEITYNVSSSGFMPFKQGVALAHVTSSNSTGGFYAYPGVNTISGTLTHSIVMPLASENAGAVFAFRNISAQGHILTGSLESLGTQVFEKIGALGATFTFGASVGAGAVFYCDGLKYRMIGGSGSIT